MRRWIASREKRGFFVVLAFLIAIAVCTEAPGRSFYDFGTSGEWNGIAANTVNEKLVHKTDDMKATSPCRLLFGAALEVPDDATTGCWNSSINKNNELVEESKPESSYERNNNISNQYALSEQGSLRNIAAAPKYTSSNQNIFDSKASSSNISDENAVPAKEDAPSGSSSYNEGSLNLTESGSSFSKDRITPTQEGSPNIHKGGQLRFTESNSIVFNASNPAAEKTAPSGSSNVHLTGSIVKQVSNWSASTSNQAASWDNNATNKDSPDSTDLVLGVSNEATSSRANHATPSISNMENSKKTNLASTTKEAVPSRGKLNLTEWIANASNETTAPATKNSACNSSKNNRVVHKAKFGIGHRLCRMASAFHLAQLVGAPEFQPEWDDCPNNPKLFEFLFGNGSLAVPTSLGQYRCSQHGNTAVVRNDVRLYVAATRLQQTQLNLSPALFTANASASLFWDKVESDRTFFKQLMDRFQAKGRIDSFWKEHQLEQHTLIGVHLRLGNGEKDHFELAGRAINNETHFVIGVAKLLNQMALEQTALYGGKTPIIFLATDSAYVIDLFSSSTKIPVITMPQYRPRKGEGVLFMEQKAGQCTHSWQDMLLDMILLAKSTTVVAPLGSSFTQSLPLTIVLDQDDGMFCQASRDAQYMTCFRSMEAYLFRFKIGDMINYYTGSANNISSARNSAGQSLDLEDTPYVSNALLTELPSPGILDALPFIRLSNRMAQQPHNIQKSTFLYGRAFDPTFREMPIRPDNRTNWHVSNQIQSH